MIMLKRDRDWNSKYSSGGTIIEIVGVEEVNNVKEGDQLVIEVEGLGKFFYRIVESSGAYMSLPYPGRTTRMLLRQATGFQYDEIPPEMLKIMSKGFYIYQLIPEFNIY